MATDSESAGQELAQHIAAALKNHPGPAEVRINPNVQAPIPPRIAGNILELLRRVPLTGMDSIAWVEAYTYVQQHAPQRSQPGVPFNGLPQSQP